MIPFPLNVRLLYYGSKNPMRLTEDEKGIPGKCRRMFLELHHRCDDKERFCRRCLISHKKEVPCKMRFKKLQPESQRPAICYVSFATMSSNSSIDCYRCYTNENVCKLHQGIMPAVSNHMCNAIYTLRDVSFENVASK